MVFNYVGPTDEEGGSENELGSGLVVDDHIVPEAVKDQKVPCYWDWE